MSQDSGINLEEEQNALLGNKGGAEAPAPPKQQSTLAEDTFLNLSPLQIKVSTTTTSNAYCSSQKAQEEYALMLQPH